MGKLRLGVLLSGSGRTLQNFIDLIAAGKLPAEIAVVISDQAGVKGLERAKDAGLKTVLIRRKGTPTEQFNRRITEASGPSGSSWSAWLGSCRFGRFHVTSKDV